jgi:antitoxin (DNA-binding transcriptional repressor) of toxin-antitoxin stability system
MGDTPAVISIDDPQPGSWADLLRRAERGETVAVLAHGDHVADVVPSGALARLRETVEVLSDSELVRDLQQGLADARAKDVVPAADIAKDLEARRSVGE